jgi:hypothetical protein
MFYDNADVFISLFIAGLELVNVESQTDMLVGMLASDKLPHYAGIIKISHVVSTPTHTCRGQHQKLNDKFEFYDFSPLTRPAAICSFEVGIETAREVDERVADLT